jgi:hypothetical protein
MTFGEVKYHGRNLDIIFVCVIIFFYEAFDIEMLRNIELMLGQTLNHSV